MLYNHARFVLLTPARFCPSMCTKQGPPGETGATGTWGPTGPQGPKGDTGTANVIYSQWVGESPE
jgi:hypothetical protein